MSNHIIKRGNRTVLIFDRAEGDLEVSGGDCITLTRAEARNLASALLQFATHGPQEDVDGAFAEPEAEPEAFDSRKHLWGVDAAWEGPDYPKPLAVVAPGGYAGAGGPSYTAVAHHGTPKVGAVVQILGQTGSPIQSTDLRALNEAIDIDFSPLVGIHLTEESRTAA